MAHSYVPFSGLFALQYRVTSLDKKQSLSSGGCGKREQGKQHATHRREITPVSATQLCGSLKKYAQ